MALRPYTKADEEQLKRELQEAISHAGPPRILGVKRRTRARWWLAHRVDSIAIWLCGHHHEDAAILLWRTCKMW